MTDGIFSDDLPDVEESPVNGAGQGSVEQVAGPADAGQPGETGATEQAAQEAPQEQAQQPLLGKFKNVEDLAKSYQELERKLGSRDEEKEQLRQQLAMLQGYLQALPQIMGQQAQQAQAQPQLPQQPDEDEKVLRDLEELYPGLNRALAKRYESAVSKALQNLQTQVAQQIQPLQQFVQQMQLMEFYRQQVASAKAKFGDFDEFKGDIERIYQEQPMLCGLPNGMEVAYQLAKARRTISTQAATQAATEKAAARLPGSSGARADKTLTPEQQFLKSVFGEENENKGIFDD